MPWIKSEDCNGCGICISKCLVDSISLKNGVAVIDMTNCIHCGICHTVCPNDAVRHDSERIPEEVRANVSRTKEFMEACSKYLGDEKEKQKCLTRMMKHFNKEKIVAERTLEELRMLKKLTTIKFLYEQKNLRTPNPCIGVFVHNPDCRGFVRGDGV